MEPYQRCFDIVKQTFPWRTRRSGTGDEYIVITRETKLRQKFTRDNTQTAPCPVSDNSAANFFGGGKTFTDMCLSIRAITPLNDHQMPAH